MVRKNTNSLATSEGPSPVSPSLPGSRGSSRPPWRTRPAGPACESCIFCYKQGGASETSSLNVKRICSIGGHEEALGLPWSLHPQTPPHPSPSRRRLATLPRREAWGCLESSHLGLQGHPGPRGRPGPKGSKGEEVRRLGFSGEAETLDPGLV